ncbi:unnamed protein product [Miscanthus lutarioriparius]|uniref:Protein kinase domain-containing protein n=1 Tax=Miscanthus lutarioriparius TaxID=422564 RepID=A0A811RAF6_9POAL|nr:unnamed protein product [Miscanthus lutarioriparius]
MKEALLILLFINFLVTMVSATPSELGISLPGCPNKCGNVSIPYPFDIGASCAATNLNSYFALTCNNSFQPPRPMFGVSPRDVEVIDIFLEHGEAHVYGDVSYSCFTSNSTSYNYTTGFRLDTTPFIISTRNHFTVIGCNTLWLIGSTMDNSSDLHVAGCYSYCEGINSTSNGAPCTGTGCCETAISSNLTDFIPIITMNESSVWNFNPCSYAMLVEAGWYSFRSQDLIGDHGFINDRAPRGVPVVNDWAIRNSSCPKDGAKAPKDYACVSSNSYCVNASNGPGYLCKCSIGYEGNPYLLKGCHDIDECELRKQDVRYKKLYPCENGRCRNTPGGYICKCRIGTRSDGTNSGCRPVLSKAEQAVIVSIRKEKDEYFKQNGGLRLYDKMRSRQVDTVLILSENEIKKATDNFSEDNVLGCDGHGMVYRGTLDDNKEVAIKKSKLKDDDSREEFVNEIIILSQINHRNIVRLLGCCLEIDVTMLVYEYISNEALAYIHSATSRTILRGDVKSLNILLDEEYNAKVSDFGASALKSMDKNDFIMLIQGTLGYIDPESFVSHHLSDKSDVYSSGVVLLELMTRKKALYIDASNEKRALSHTFIQMFHQNELRDILDSEIVHDETMIVLQKLAELVMHCLSPKGDERPTMKEVAERLQMLRRLEMQQVTKTPPIQAHHYYEEQSVYVPSDETEYQSMETTKLELEVDIVR